MNDTNPFSAPSESPAGGSPRGRSGSVLISSVVGGLIGLMLGVFGIVALFLIIPGAPGLVEILLLGLGVIAVLMLPGAVIGAVVGFAMNSRSSDGN